MLPRKDTFGADGNQKLLKLIQLIGPIDCNITILLWMLGCEDEESHLLASPSVVICCCKVMRGKGANGTGAGGGGGFGIWNVSLPPGTDWQGRVQRPLLFLYGSWNLVFGGLQAATPCSALGELGLVNIRQKTCFLFTCLKFPLLFLFCILKHTSAVH